MKKTPLHYLVFFFTALLISCSKAENKTTSYQAQHQINGEKCLEYTQLQCQLGPRTPGSIASQKTREWILSKASELKIHSHIDNWTDRVYNHDLELNNVICTLGDKEKNKEFILFASHYDCKQLENFNGANDSASSTALVVHLMEKLSANPELWQGLHIRFAFFDGEECQRNYSHKDGLHGSKRYASQIIQDGDKENCRAMILLDMIGDKDLHIELPVNSNRELNQKALSAAKELKLEKHISLSEKHILDDHQPFHELGIPSTDFIDFSYGPNNSFWHTSQDSIDKLSAESFAITGDICIQLLKKLNSTRP